MSPDLREAVARAREQRDYQGLTAAIPYARFLGIQLDHSSEGLVSRLPFRDGLVGNRSLPAVHGGVTAAFMEHAAILSLLLELDEPRLPKSVDFAIDYLQPARAFDTFAACTISRAGGRVAQTVIHCWQAEREKPVAIARAHFLLCARE